MPSDIPTEGYESEEEQSPEDEEAGSSEEGPIPDSDVAGTAEWSVVLSGDEEAAVTFGGENVGQGRISSALAASLLSRISGFVRPLTGIVPDFTGISATASVTFHFGPGYGEQYQLTDEGDVATSLRDAFEELVHLIELTPDDAALLEQARSMHAHAIANYVHLLEIISAENLTATVLVRERSTSTVLQPRRASEARAVLERPAPERYEDRNVTGYLYEANAKKHGFELEEIGVTGRIEGRYLPELDEEIGKAWNKIAEVSIRMKWTRLERARNETLEDVELRRVLKIIEGPPQSLI